MQVYLEDIADELEGCMDCWTQFLNTGTGEVVALGDGIEVDRDEALAEEIMSTGCYVRLPNQYELHEWHIMEDFAEACPSERKRERLLDALYGRKAYRRFKDEIINLGIEEAYYAYRFLDFCKIAKEWCEDNDIPYTTR